MKIFKDFPNFKLGQTEKIREPAFVETRGSERVLTSEHLSSEEHLMSKFWRVWT
jgi:hypothetical protein